MTLQKGYFTVPNDVSDERVIERKEAYIKKYAEHYDKDGWMLISPIAFYKSSVPLTEDIAQGRTRWAIKAYWDRKPIEQTLEVNEKIIPKLLETRKFSLS